MSDHLPECPLGQPCQSSEPDHVMQGTIAGIPVTVCGLCMADCICNRLRTCEQRVLAEREADGPWFRSVVHQCCEDKQTAYAAGLDAAREAVAATFIGWCKDYMNCTDYEHVCGKRREIITAIDALREAER